MPLTGVEQNSCWAWCSSRLPSTTPSTRSCWSGAGGLSGRPPAHREPTRPLPSRRGGSWSCSPAPCRRAGRTWPPPDGERPLDAETAWGWRRDAYAAWEPKGERVGWVDGEDLYLLPDAAYAAVQRLGQEIGDRIALTPQVLRKRLKERGILLTCETQRRMLTVRRTLEGQRREVLHLHRDALCASTDAPGSDDARAAPWSTSDGSQVAAGSWQPQECGSARRSGWPGTTSTWALMLAHAASGGGRLDQIGPA